MGVVSLVSSILLARIYGVTVIGQYALVLSVVLFTVIFSTLREQTAFVRTVAVLDRYDARISGAFYAVLSLSIGITCVVGGLTFLVSSALFRGALNQPDVVAATGIALLSHLTFERIAWTLDSVLVAFRRAKELFWLRLLQVLCFSALAVGLGAFGGYDSLMSLVLANVASFGFFVFIRIIIVRKYMRFIVPMSAIRSGFSRLPSYVRFGIRSIGVTVAAVGRVAPTWVLASTGSIAQVGAYSRAELIATRVTEGTWRVSEMLLPTLVERRDAVDNEGFDRSLIDTIRYMVIALLALAAAGGGAAVGVMQAFGPGFHTAANALALLLVFPAISAVTMCEKQALYALDRPMAASVVAIIELVLLLILAVTLGLAFGPTGVAAALVISATVAASLYWSTLRAHLQNSLRHYWCGREMLLLLLSYAAGFGAARAIDLTSDDHLVTVLAVAVGAIVYGALFLVTGGLNQRDKDRIRSLLGPFLRHVRFVGFGRAS